MNNRKPLDCLKEKIIPHYPFSFNFHRSDRSSENSSKEPPTPPRYSINRYHAAPPYNFLLSQTGRQDLLTFFPLCFAINDTNSFEWADLSGGSAREKRRREKEEKREREDGEICKQRDVTLSAGFDALLKRLSLLLCELDFAGCAKTEKLRRGVEPIS